MSGRPRLFLFLPGIVAGLILAAVALEASRTAFPGDFEKVFPPHTLLLIAAAVAATSIVGLVNLLLVSRESTSLPNDLRDAKSNNSFPSGGTRAD
jgi:hypothetical protein